ncbi:MAG: hypothetical protein AB1711_08015 [Thermodesulfobacteriota bacterium]
MSIKRRIKKLEQNIQGQDHVPLVAAEYPDGSYEHQGQVYENKEAFDRAMDAILGDNPTKPLVILTEYANRKKVSDEA